VIPRLLKEVEEILAGHKFQEKKQEGRCLQCTMERHDVRVGGQRLMDRCLKHLRRQLLLVEISLAEKLDCILLAILCRPAPKAVLVIHVIQHQAIVTRTLSTVENLTDKVDNGIRTCSESTNDLEL